MGNFLVFHSISKQGMVVHVFVARLGKSFGLKLPAAVWRLVLVVASDVLAAASHVYFPRANRFGKVFAYQARLQMPFLFPRMKT